MYERALKLGGERPQLLKKVQDALDGWASKKGLQFERKARPKKPRKENRNLRTKELLALTEADKREQAVAETGDYYSRTHGGR